MARNHFSSGPGNSRRGASRPFSKQRKDGGKPFGKRPTSDRPEGEDQPKRSSGRFPKAAGRGRGDRGEGGSSFFSKRGQRYDKGEGFKRSSDDKGRGEKRPISGRRDGDSTQHGKGRGFYKKDNFSSEGGSPFFSKRGQRYDKGEGFKRSPDDKGRGEKRPISGRRQGDSAQHGKGRGFYKKDNSRHESGRPFKQGRRPGKETPEGARGRKSFVKSRIERQQLEERPQEQQKTGDGLIRLNKFISNSGVCSRREADELIAMGLVTVNGKSVTEMGYKVKPTDDVRYEGKKLKAEKPVYILLNKPKGYITTTDDPQERHTVMHLIEGACKERVYPVGRLDRNTSGLLLLTNDGELTEKLTHPSYNVKKIYKAELDRPLTRNDFQKILDGVQLDEGKAMVDDLAMVSDDGKTVGLEIHIGWNRIVRRIFEALGYEVVRLDRTAYATLDKKELPRGHWRFLRQEEVVRLKHFL
ncbi:MAG: rRNA pseudouridine synthase [Bacteroidetes bacterium]|nr:rRNA pseudouridine synthase [Bacteroidota bacterium]